GAAPLVSGQPVAFPETIATAIRIGNPASWDGAIAARDESGGAIGAVSDLEILDAYRLLAQKEGVFCEPASAASVAGLLRAGAGAGGLEQPLAVHRPDGSQESGLVGGPGGVVVEGADRRRGGIAELDLQGQHLAQQPLDRRAALGRFGASGLPFRLFRQRLD